MKKLIFFMLTMLIFVAINVPALDTGPLGLKRDLSSLKSDNAADQVVIQSQVDYNLYRSSAVQSPLNELENYLSANLATPIRNCSGQEVPYIYIGDMIKGSFISSKTNYTANIPLKLYMLRHSYWMAV